MLMLSNADATVGRVHILQKKCPQQKKFTSDCAIFMLNFIDLMIQNKSIFDFHSRHCSESRKEMAKIIGVHVSDKSLIAFL